MTITSFLRKTKKNQNSINNQFIFYKKGGEKNITISKWR